MICSQKGIRSLLQNRDYYLNLVRSNNETTSRLEYEQTLYGSSVNEQISRLEYEQMVAILRDENAILQIKLNAVERKLNSCGVRR